MSKGVNRVIILGNLGKDPEVRYMPSGAAITNITIATSDSYKSKESGELVTTTEWHKVVFYNKLAEIAGEYLKKGSKVYVEGSLKTQKWKDKEGNDRYTTQIIGREMQMLDGKSSEKTGQVKQEEDDGFTVKEGEKGFLDDDIPF